MFLFDNLLCHLQSCTFYTARFHILPYFLFTLCILTLCGYLTAVPNLGPLYDCSHLNDQAYFRFPQLQNCSHNMHELNDSVKFFTAQVRQPYSPRTPISLYHCTVEIRQFNCHEKFFSQTSKHYSVQQTVVSKQDCITVILRNTSPFGLLIRVSHNRWITRNHDQYSCSWLKTKVNHFTHLITVTSYHGELIANDSFIHQSVTHTTAIGFVGYL